ncbi:MAG: hypothetical protein J6Z82_04790 [Schwartzia sp.]|nr:hypothetical protein [Schwartzia sp. (in: firmicutes)]
MKALAIGVLTAVLLGTTLGTPVCFAADVEEDGGTRDTSARHASPVAIASTEIASFKLRFEFGKDFDEEDEGRGCYPSGWYDLRLKKTENGADCHLEYWTQSEPGRKADFPVKADALARLDALLKEHDVAQIDGHSMWNSALGDFMNLEVDYESGEQIYASGEGGGVKPDPQYYQEEWFIDFFRALGREYGHDVLGPALRRCSYSRGGGKPGAYLGMDISMQKDGAVIAEMDSRDRYDAPTVHREIVVPKEKLGEIAAMFDRGELFHWAKTKWNKIDVLDGDTVEVSFDYADGNYASLYDDNEMPKEALEAMAKVRAFLGELLKDAPQANKGDTR